VAGEPEGADGCQELAMGERVAVDGGAVAPTEREAAVAREIRRLAREELELDGDFTDGEELAGRLDSLALLSLVVAVEDRFRVKLGDLEATRVRSLADLAALVARKAGSAPGEAR
jgi:acyl carrier protein